MAGLNDALEIEGQMNTEERRILRRAVLDASPKPEIVIEVGTWLGGGSTLHLLRALEENGIGHLWGIEADRSIYNAMLANVHGAAPEAVHRFTPLFGLSHEVIPKWLADKGPEFAVDLVFLDGGDNPMEQITEFQLLDPRVPVGGQLLAHDAKLRKGKWLHPYLAVLDHWEVELHDVSTEGLLQARKLREAPSDKSSRTAAKVLARLRRDPAEMIGRWLPAPVNAAILRLLPKGLRDRVSQGR